ncbi:hypothetical protein HELRODRAFT_136198, partial [Helobdella robusta]|uniref:VWA N-terminal domain-containing protein n=1 Tax=Helobdella robusta TaxID=6412 RepID=T1EIC6_HELRO
IISGATWTSELDGTFTKNFQDDPDLSWQVFASSAGFMRIFPGFRWPSHQEDDVDLYDCRLQPWYIRAANSPKNAIILIDSSGSMRGLRREIARTTVEKIVETFGVDDFFNV